MEFPKISCIYCIECVVNGKKYIGQTINLKSRFNWHQYYLRKINHTNPFLQKDYLLYGDENFVYYILEYCKESELDNREKYLIKKYKTFIDKNKGYNQDCGGGGDKEKDYFVNKRQAKSILRKQEFDNIYSTLQTMLNKKILATEIAELKKYISNNSKTVEITNTRAMGIRAINHILQEMNIPYKIISGTISIKNRNNTYWMVQNG